MTINVVEAAKETLPRFYYTAARDSQGMSIGHAAWMLAKISTGTLSQEKACRWLGYAQALAVVHRMVSLGTVKDINLKAEQENQS